MIFYFGPNSHQGGVKLPPYLKSDWKCVRSQNLAKRKVVLRSLEKRREIGISSRDFDDVIIFPKNGHFSSFELCIRFSCLLSRLKFIFWSLCFTIKLHIRPECVVNVIKNSSFNEVKTIFRKIMGPVDKKPITAEIIITETWKLAEMFKIETNWKSKSFRLIAQIVFEIH